MKKTISVFIALLLIVAAFAVGFYLGQNSGEQKATEKFQALIDRTYPSPPEVMHILGGVVKGVYGGTINIEVVNPDDYLPHTDGSPYEKEVRFANISSDTEIIEIDYLHQQPDGTPTITQLELSDLQEGDEIQLTSDENIRDAKKFDVTRVEVIRY